MMIDHFFAAKFVISGVLSAQGLLIDLIKLYKIYIVGSTAGAGPAAGESG